MNTDITAAFTELVQLTEAMNNWVKDKALSATVYRLPVLTERVVPDLIPCVEVTGDEALKAAMFAYSKFDYLTEQSTGTAYRLPGVVYMGEANLDAVDAVNLQKAKLQDLIKSAAPKKHDRLKLCRELLTGCSMSQVYRDVVAIQGDVQSIRFTWMTHSVGATRLSRSEACGVIQSNIDAESQLGDSARVTALSITKERVTALNNDDVIMMRRPVPPHPRANIVMATGNLQEKANMPFLVSGTPDSISQGALRAFDLSKKRTERSDKLNTTLLHEGLGLHLLSKPVCQP